MSPSSVLRGIALAAMAWISCFVGPAARAGDEPNQRAPDAGAGTTVFEWTSKGGVTCAWRAPKKYDAARGANVTVILHGSNLSHRWGFANHDAANFRPDDFVLVPDGTTPAQGGEAFNFMEGDTRKAHALVEELKKAVKVRSVYLYGHSQGSFFALAWAGDFPDDVQGVVAHASGLWASSQRGPKGFGQAIVFLHGTQDPVVPYGQSVGGFEALRDAGYPKVRLRSLEWWNHWPAEMNGPVRHTSQQLAWVEGMTTDDAERMAVCLDVLADVPEGGEQEHDFAGLRSLADRIASADGAPEALRKKAADLRDSVDALAERHVAALAIPEKAAFDGKPWIGHLPTFLRAFQGVPACDSFAAKLAPVLDAHRKDAVAHLRKHYAALKPGKEADAFDAGVAAVASGFLWTECWNADFRKRLRDARDDAKKLKLAKAALKTYDSVFPDFEKALTDGSKAFADLNRKR